MKLFQCGGNVYDEFGISFYLAEIKKLLQREGIKLRWNCREINKLLYILNFE